jgi:Xaa-Pro dipeptidase
MTSRIEKAIASLSQHHLDALVLNPGPTQFYFSGLHLHLSERPMCLFLLPGKAPAIVLPAFEREQLANTSLAMQAFFFDDDPAEWQKAFDDAAAYGNLAGKTIGIEPTQMRYLEMQYVQQSAANLSFTSAAELIADLRMRKDASEQAAMQVAVNLSEQALRSALAQFQPYMTEKEFANVLLMQMLQAGAEDLSFGSIVAGGPNSANPHATPTDRPIQPGDLLVIDFGAKVNGYCADITRTFAIGQIDLELVKIHEITQAANAAARDFARPGVSAHSVDQAARSVIEQAGYGQYFTHRLGHGLGLEGHEPPYMHGGNPLILQPGMTFTIEPGIYLPGRGGVRVEDDVIITADGCRSLTTFPRELITL